MVTFVRLELQTLQTGEGRHPGNDREAPQEPAAASDDWYVTTISGLTMPMCGCLTLDGKHVLMVSKIYCLQPSWCASP